MRLNDLEKGQEAMVLVLEGESEVVERLEEMGLGRGRAVRLLRKIPLGGPFVVQAGPTFIAVRESEATFIKVGVEK